MLKYINFKEDYNSFCELPERMETFEIIPHCRNVTRLSQKTNEYNICLNYLDSKMLQVATFPTMDMPNLNYFSYYYTYIFSEVNKKKDIITNQKVKSNLKKFEDRMLLLLSSSYNSDEYRNILPPLRLTIDEDESLYLEWIFTHFRIGILIELEEDNSEWFLTTDKKLLKNRIAVTLNGNLFDNLDLNLIAIINFALEHTRYELPQ